MNFQIVLNVLSINLILFSFFNLFPIAISIIYKTQEVKSFLINWIITFLTGIFLYFFTKKYKYEEIREREAFASVTLIWVTIAFFGALPYLFTGALNTFTDAYFESMSGFTTTGITAIPNVEALPQGILFWRALTQWIGGLGIIVLVLAILPVIGTKGMQLFKAEVPGIKVDKLKPKIVDTAKLLSLIYIGITVIIIILYKLCGMDLYDAICHAFTTIATGGFSTKNNSFASFKSPLIEYVTIFAMLAGGINFGLYFYLLKGEIKKILTNSELKFYLFLLLLFIFSIVLNLKFNIYSSFEKAFRYGTFQIVSILTTTGYSTTDYTQWNPFPQILMLFGMFIGSMMGSTSGGIKQIRIFIIFKYIYTRFYHFIHPRAITSIKINETPLSEDVLENIWGFIFLVILSWIISSILLTVCNLDMITSMSATACALNNVGIALGEAGPASTYASFPVFAKWVLIFDMLVGRLEYYTVLILFIPAFWKK